jgi:uncharacterized protein
MYDLALFPLNTVLFPGMPLHLHIFEPRYRMLLRRCIEDQRPFGVVLIARGLEAGGPAAEPFSVGTTARVADVEPLDGGRFNLTALGEERFRIRELDREQPYLVGKVEGLPLEHPQTIETHRQARRLSPWVQAYLTLLAQADQSLALDLAALQLPDDPLSLVYWAATLLQIPAIEKQPLLEAARAADLLAHVARLYRRETTLLRRELQAGEKQEVNGIWLN